MTDEEKIQEYNKLLKAVKVAGKIEFPQSIGFIRDAIRDGILDKRGSDRGSPQDERDRYDIRCIFKGI